MASDDIDGLGSLEAAVMRVMWAASEPLNVRAVLERLNEARPRALAYTTVMTVMARLAEKGLLDRHLEGRGYLYEPTAGDVAELAVRHVMREFGDAAVAHFVAEARANPRTLRRLQRLLEDDSS